MCTKVYFSPFFADLHPSFSIAAQYSLTPKPLSPVIIVEDDAHLLILEPIPKLYPT